MKRIGLWALALMAAVCAGCAAAQPGGAPTAGQTTGGNPESAKPAEPAAQADWVIQVDDAQTVTDEDGVLWTYTLSMYVKKSGGPLGEYAGDIVLTMEPDFDSVAALLQREGDKLGSLYFRYRAESTQGRICVVAYDAQNYAALMKEHAPNQPGMQMPDPNAAYDGMAILGMEFQTVMEPIVMSGVGQGGKQIAGSAGGQSQTVVTPFLLTMEAATVFVQFPEPIHPLGRAFRGTVTGDLH